MGNPNIVGDYELGKRRSFGCRAEKTEPPNNHHIARTGRGGGRANTVDIFVQRNRQPSRNVPTSGGGLRWLWHGRHSILIYIYIRNRYNSISTYSSDSRDDRFISLDPSHP